MVATRAAAALQEAEWWYRDMRGASYHARVRLGRVSKRDGRFRGLKRAAEEAARLEAEALAELNECQKVSQKCSGTVV